jgi:uncharacterized membrane protein
MQMIERSIEVNAPISKVYNQWTQFESFPQFMQGIEEVRQIDEKHLHWKANILGKEEEWEAEIHEQVPDQKIAWRSVSGVAQTGIVTFRAKGADVTEITLVMHYEPHGFLERTADLLGVTTTRIRSDLERFKEFIESREAETGAWRGEIHEDETHHHHS